MMLGYLIVLIVLFNCIDCVF